MTTTALPTTTPSAPAEWNPALSVSYSSLTDHRQCPQAWAYKYVRGLETTRTTTARDLGSWWHLVRAMDSIHRGLLLDSLRYAPALLHTGDDRIALTLTAGDPIVDANGRWSQYRLPSGQIVPATVEVALAIAAAYWRRLDGEAKDGWIEVLGMPLAERLAYMHARWLEQWAADLPHEAPVGVEIKGRTDVPGTPATMGWVVDEVYVDTRRNLTVVRDSKSQKSLPTAESGDDLSDSQLHLYAWAVQALLSEQRWGLEPVSALSYDRVRSAPPKTPALTASGGLSKSVTDYDLHTYLAFAAGPEGVGIPWGEEGTYVASGPRKGAPKFGVYEAERSVIEKLSTPSAQSVWFQRTLVPVNTNVIRSHLTAMADTQRQAARTLETYADHGEAPRNFHRLLCSWCDFKDLCRAEMIGGPGGDYPLEQFNLTERRNGHSLSAPPTTTDGDTP